MLVKELIEKLKLLDQEATVYTASDEEGNEYRRLGYDPTEFMAYPENGIYVKAKKNDPYESNWYRISIAAKEDINDGKFNEEELSLLRKVVIIG